MMRRAIFLMAMMASLGFEYSAQAAITFELRTGVAATRTQSMPIDSNNCVATGPRAMYVGGVITNTGAADVTNIVATISGLGSGFALAGGQAASQAIGSLGAGQSTGAYWFVGYGCTDLASTAPTIAITSSTASSSTLLTLTARSAISANAGGNVLSSTLGPGAVVGQTIFFDTSYDFGGSAVGDEFFLQPSGAQNFNAACFRLVGTEILQSNITPIVVGSRDRLYFVQSQRQSGNGYFANVRYSFEYQCAGASTTARPYAVQTSGSTNIKYTGNYDGAGSISVSFTGATNPFTISKVADKSIAPAGSSEIVKYTIVVTNPSAFASRIEQFEDILPPGASFAGLDPASNVTAANSSSVPGAGATGPLVFAGRRDSSYLIPAGGTVRLIYSIRMPTVAGSYPNSARARFGTSTTPTATAAFQVIDPIALSVTKASLPYSDPVNGSSQPKLIPGGFVNYRVTVANPNIFPVTADSIEVVDPTPGGLRFFVGDLNPGGGPMLFQDGSVPTGLTYSFTSLSSPSDDIDFSNDSGATWTYTPAPDVSGLDAAITHFRIKPKGAMAAGSDFVLTFRYSIQ